MLAAQSPIPHNAVVEMQGNISSGWDLLIPQLFWGVVGPPVLFAVPKYTVNLSKDPKGYPNMIDNYTHVLYGGHCPKLRHCRW